MHVAATVSMDATGSDRPKRPISPLTSASNAAARCAFDPSRVRAARAVNSFLRLRMNKGAATSTAMATTIVAAIAPLGMLSSTKPIRPSPSVAATSRIRSRIIQAPRRGVRWRVSSSGANSPTRPGDRLPPALDTKNRPTACCPEPNNLCHLKARSHRAVASAAIMANRKAASRPRNASSMRCHPMYQITSTYKATPLNHK